MIIHIAAAWKHLEDFWRNAHPDEHGCVSYAATLFRGLCASIERIFEIGLIDEETEQAMLTEVRQYGRDHGLVGKYGHVFYWPTDRAGAISRAECCQHFAQLTRKLEPLSPPTQKGDL